MKRIVFALLLILAAPAFAGAAAQTAQPAAPEGTQEARRKLDVNRASPAELVAVPGIGERLAASIIELRERVGSFAKLEDLLEVRGIGEKNLAHLSAYLTVVPAPQQAASGKAVPVK